jgi:hypothetical protein
MALPKLNDQPKFEITVPSTKEMHRFRPFLVKEEKVLLIALESNDQRQMLNAIADTVDACSNGSVKVNELTTYDIEYLFTQLRGKSVGETTKLQMICKECENTTEAVINLDDIKMTGGTTSPLIEISPNISVELSYPAYVNMMNDDTIMGDDASAATFAMIRSCIKAVLTDDERIDMKDEDPKAVDEFIESMNSAQFQKIREFIDDMPAMKHNVEFTCDHCKHENKTVLEGMQAFFS